MGNRAGQPHRYRPRNPCRIAASGKVRLVVFMDEETYDEIDAAAKANDVTISAQTTMFIDIGIETMAIEAQLEQAA